MSPRENIDRILDRALSRLGNASQEQMESARERVRQSLRGGRAGTEDPLPDAEPVSLWVLRRPFMVAASVLVAVAGLSGAAIGTLSWQIPDLPAPVVLGGPAAPEAVRPPSPEPERVIPQVSAPPEPEPVTQRQPSGGEILDRACGSCHSPDVVENLDLLSRSEYEQLVLRKIDMGAELSGAETPVLVEYLVTSARAAAASLAARPATQQTPPPPDQPQPAPQQTPPDDPGKDIANRACTTCHDMTAMNNHVYDNRDAYAVIVSNMNAYGAGVTDKEMGPLVNYLLRTYGRK